MAGVVKGVGVVRVPVLRIPFHRELRAHAPGGACGFIFLRMREAFAARMPRHPLKLRMVAQAALCGQWGHKRLFSRLAQPAAGPARYTASQRKVNRFFYLVWLIGAGVWFFDAVLSMHRHSLARGLAQAGVAAGFLAVGMLFRQNYRQQQQRRQRQNGGDGKNGSRKT
jgi:hypothetical protein